MLLHPRHFVAFLDGRYGDIATIAYVPGEFTRQIGSLSSDLLCGREYGNKLKDKHGLRYEQFQLIQPAINDGYVRRVGLDLEFLYYDPSEAGSLPYLLAVKAVGQNEIWLRTFYRTERWKEETFFQRGTMLKEHVDRE